MHTSPKRIFLIGFMGAGKSSVGSSLSSMLNCDFIDSDREIELNEAATINEIVKNNSWSYFRVKESEWLMGLNQDKPFVCATGGGLPCYNDNMNKMLALGTVIYLECTPQVLFDRLTKERKWRPLIADLTDSELIDYIKNTLEKRNLFYNLAQVKVNGDNSIEKVCLEILRSIDSN
jgi:shikimate kinase